jgi:hypothetical protein
MVGVDLEAGRVDANHPRSRHGRLYGCIHHRLVDDDTRQSHSVTVSPSMARSV